MGQTEAFGLLKILCCGILNEFQSKVTLYYRNVEVFPSLAHWGNRLPTSTEGNRLGINQTLTSLSQRSLELFGSSDQSWRPFYIKRRWKKTIQLWNLPPCVLRRRAQFPLSPIKWNTVETTFLTFLKPLLAKVHKYELDCSTFNTTFLNPCWLRWLVNATQTQRLNIFCPLDVSRVIEHSLLQRVPHQSSCCGCSTEGTWCPNRPVWSPASLQPSPSAPL